MGSTQIPTISRMRNSRDLQRVVEYFRWNKLTVKRVEIFHKYHATMFNFLVDNLYEDKTIVLRWKLLTILCLDVISVLYVSHQLITVTDLLCLSPLSPPIPHSLLYQSNTINSRIRYIKSQYSKPLKANKILGKCSIAVKGR